MAKMVLVQLVCSEAEPTTELLRHILESQGCLGPNDHLQIMRVPRLPQGPPSYQELVQLREVLQLGEDDELEVIAARFEPNVEPPPEVLDALLLGLAFAEMLGEPDVPTPRVPTYPLPEEDDLC